MNFKAFLLLITIGFYSCSDSNSESKKDGKYTDNAQKVEVAARYSAWERTAWYQELPSSLQEANSNIDTEKSAEEIGFELQNRVFSNKNSAIYLAQKTDSITEEVDPMSESFWVDDTLHFIEIKITCRVPYLSVF